MFTRLVLVIGAKSGKLEELSGRRKEVVLVTLGFVVKIRFPIPCCDTAAITCSNFVSGNLSRATQNIIAPELRGASWVGLDQNGGGMACAQNLSVGYGSGCHPCFSWRNNRGPRQATVPLKGAGFRNNEVSLAAAFLMSLTSLGSFTKPKLI